MTNWKLQSKLAIEQSFLLVPTALKLLYKRASYIITAKQCADAQNNSEK
jgi:hypothetical protein